MAGFPGIAGIPVRCPLATSPIKPAWPSYASKSESATGATWGGFRWLILPVLSR